MGKYLLYQTIIYCKIIFSTITINIPLFFWQSNFFQTLQPHESINLTFHSMWDIHQFHHYSDYPYWTMVFIPLFLNLYWNQIPMFSSKHTRFEHLEKIYFAKPLTFWFLKFTVVFFLLRILYLTLFNQWNQWCYLIYFESQLNLFLCLSKNILLHLIHHQFDWHFLITVLIIILSFYV